MVRAVGWGFKVLDRPSKKDLHRYLRRSTTPVLCVIDAQYDLPRRPRNGAATLSMLEHKNVWRVLQLGDRFDRGRVQLTTLAAPSSRAGGVTTWATIDQEGVQALLGDRERILSDRPTLGRRRPMLHDAPTADDLEPGYDEEPGQSRRVNTGFSALSSPQEPLCPKHALSTATEYYFWFEVGPKASGAIENRPVRLPGSVPRDAELSVALFSHGSGITVPTTEGRVRLSAGRMSVVAQPDPLPFDDTLLERRLFFRVQMPPAPGAATFHCNVYYKRFLVQSLLITAETSSEGERQAGMLRSELDYVRSHSLEELETLGSHRLSVVGHASDASHEFSFYGGDIMRGSASFDVAELQDYLDQARRAYCRISWGSPTKFNAEEPQPFRYHGPADPGRFREDVVHLACVGFKMWTGIGSKLSAEAGGPSRRRLLQEKMRQPGGRIQLALRQGSRNTLPLALVYDHPLDADREERHLSICDQFQRDSMGDIQLAHCLDPNRGCPNYEDRLVVCPAGFWGFRHTIGVPASLGDRSGPVTQLGTRSPVFTALAWAESDFCLRDAHLDALRALYGPGYNEARDLQGAIALLRADDSHLIYFYCHGKVDDDGNPLLQVGRRQEGVIGVATFADIAWRRTRPLVFINGCHTADVAPERALQLVDELIQNTGAAGVIGTEITVFEPTAVAIADEFFQQLSKGFDVGESMKRARWMLLAEQNPLGLLYVSYVHPSLSL